MRDITTLHITGQPDNEPLSWVRWRTGDSQPRQVHQGLLSQLKSTLDDGTLIVAIASQWVTTRMVEVPARHQKQLLKALPFAIEDHIIVDIESQHLSLSQSNRADNHLHNVAIIDEQRMHDLQTVFSQANLKPARLIPDFMLIPWVQKSWGVWVDPKGCLLRISEDQGCYCEHQNLSLMLAALQNKTDQTPEQVSLYCPQGYECSAEVLAALSDLPLQQSSPVADLLSLAPRAKLEQASQNLLQGDFALHKKAGKFWPQWRIAIFLIAALAGLHLFKDGLEVWQLNKQLIAQRQHNEKVFRELFPNVKRLQEMPIRAQQEMNKLRQQAGIGESQFFSLLASMASALKNNPSLTLTELDYRNQKLDMQIQVADVEKIEQLQAALGKLPTIKLDVQSVNSTDTGAKVRLTLSPKSL